MCGASCSARAAGGSSSRASGEAVSALSANEPGLLPMPTGSVACPADGIGGLPRCWRTYAELGVLLSNSVAASTAVTVAVAASVTVPVAVTIAVRA
jgi:hypothetical protein